MPQILQLSNAIWNPPSAFACARANPRPEPRDNGHATDIAGRPSLTDTVEKVSAKKLWNRNLKR